MSEPELLPCPFCGNPAKVSDARGCIGCKDSDCAGYLIPANADEWNRRAPSTRSAALEEAARVCDDSQTAYGVVAKNLAKRIRKLAASQPALQVPGHIPNGNADPIRPNPGFRSAIERNKPKRRTGKRVP